MLTRYKVGTIDHNRSYYNLLVGNVFFEAMFSLFRIAFRGWYGIKSKWPGAAEVVHIDIEHRAGAIGREGLVN